MDYDVILVHPPAIYDFRKITIFPGTLGISIADIQFNKVSIGILSIADYLDRHKHKVIIDNVADRMMHDKNFDVEKHIKSCSARIFAIELHWQHHIQGAISIAKLYKRLHPESLIILGGLTATRFHEEIVRKYDFIDAVIRGEAEKPLVAFVTEYIEEGKIMPTPNLTYRTSKCDINITPLMKPSDSLDEFEFTRLDLLEPKESIFNAETEPRFSLITCRGCIHNCIICGGSAYTYRKHLGREKPAFRSPLKIINDIRKLNEQGIKQIGLYQDPRMGGKQYWKELIRLLSTEKLELERLTIDIFEPAEEEFVKEVANIKTTVIFYLCIDSGNEDIREYNGRHYSNQDLLNNIELCHKYGIPVTTFFSVGLASEDRQSNQDTLNLWDKLCSLDQKAIHTGNFNEIGRRILQCGPIIGPITLDPGSLAFDLPDRYGYKLLFTDIEQHIKALSKPSWHQWINYETDKLNKKALVQQILEINQNSISQREKYGVYNQSHIDLKHIQAICDMVAIEEIDYIMDIKEKKERELRLKSLYTALDSIFNPQYSNSDPYGYRVMLDRILDCYNPLH